MIVLKGEPHQMMRDAATMLSLAYVCLVKTAMLCLEKGFSFAAAFAVLFAGVMIWDAVAYPLSLVRRALMMIGEKEGAI